MNRNEAYQMKLGEFLEYFKSIPESHREVARQYYFERKNVQFRFSTDYSWEDTKPHWFKEYQYRVKPAVRKEKRWQWVMKNTDGGIWVTSAHFSQTEISTFHSSALQKVEGTEIEVEVQE